MFPSLMIRPSRTAIASRIEKSASTVRIFPLWTIMSASGDVWQERRKNNSAIPASVENGFNEWILFSSLSRIRLWDRLPLEAVPGLTDHWEGWLKTEAKPEAQGALIDSLSSRIPDPGHLGISAQ